MRPPFKFSFLRWLPFFIFTMVAGQLLLTTPIHGIADNGDFWRVMEPAGIQYAGAPGDTRYRYVVRSYQLVSPKLEKATTSAVIPALITRLIARAWGDSFDLRILGAGYLVVFLGGLCLLIRATESLLLSVGLAWLSAEPSLFLHFNSFFSEALHLCLWPWLLWLLQRTAECTIKKYAFFLAGTALLIATSKAQFIFVPVFLFAALRLVRPQWWRARISFAELLLALVAVVSFASLSLVPRGVAQMVNYQAAFTGVGTVADDPVHALDAVGIAREIQHWNGRSLPRELLTNRLPLDVKHAVEDLSRWRLLKAYVLEPGALRGSFQQIHQAMSRWPLGYLGNFEESSGEFTPPWAFSRFRDWVLARSAWLLWLVPVFAGLYVFQALGARRVDGIFPLLAFLALNSITQWPIVIIGDGFGAIHRHLIASRLCWDLLFWLLLAEVVRRGWLSRTSISSYFR